ncbi:MAG: PadR family transcriptional regulator [Nitrososphaerales archaeon]
MFGNPWMRHHRWMQRGDARVIVLKVLNKRPMHGYEVIKEIAEMFGGMYAPSAGMVYPTLQWLEDESLVNSSQEEGGKKIYRINDAGRKFLAKGQQTLERLSAFQREMPEGKLEMMRAGRKLFRTAMTSFPDVSEKKAKEATKILNEAQAKLAELVE